MLFGQGPIEAPKEFVIQRKAMALISKSSDTRLFTASLFTGMKEEASKASANHAVVGGGVCDPHNPLPSQVFRFAVASSSLAILSVCSTI